MDTLNYGRDGEAHIELFVQSKDGLPIFVSCTCDIGHTHTYGEWVEWFDRAAFRRGPREFDAPTSTIR